MPSMTAKRISPLALDPTRTTMLRRRYEAEMGKRFRALRGEVYQKLVVEDALGLRADAGRLHLNTAEITLNAPVWQFLTSPQKLLLFQAWFLQQVKARVLAAAPGSDPNTPWMSPYVDSAYMRGVQRAYVDTHAEAMAVGLSEDIYRGGQESFLKSSFSGQVASSKIELLSIRNFEELKGVTAAMGQQVNRILADGLVAGHGPAKMARAMNKSIEGMTRKRAMVIARTEIIHAHAEGQLDSFEEMNVEQVGAMAEWATAGDGKVCPICAPLEGSILTVREARGLIPRHPNCRCMWLPAAVGEETAGQAWSGDQLRAKALKSIKRETGIPDGKDARVASSWAGAGKKFSDKMGKKPGAKQFVTKAKGLNKDEAAKAAKAAAKLAIQKKAAAAKAAIAKAKAAKWAAAQAEAKANAAALAEKKARAGQAMAAAKVRFGLAPEDFELDSEGVAVLSGQAQLKIKKIKEKKIHGDKVKAGMAAGFFKNKIGLEDEHIKVGDPGDPASGTLGIKAGSVGLTGQGKTAALKSLGYTGYSDPLVWHQPEGKPKSLRPEIKHFTNAETLLEAKAAFDKVKHPKYSAPATLAPVLSQLSDTLESIESAPLDELTLHGGDFSKLSGWGGSGKKSYGGVVIDKHGRVLMREPTNHFDGYAWTFPKGGMEPGDDPLQTAMKEVGEETGHKGSLVGYLPGAFEGGTSDVHMFLFQSTGFDASKMDDETQSLRWVTKDEAKKLIAQTTNKVGQKRDLEILEEAYNQIDFLEQGDDFEEEYFGVISPDTGNVIGYTHQQHPFQAVVDAPFKAKKIAQDAEFERKIGVSTVSGVEAVALPTGVGDLAFVRDLSGSTKPVLKVDPDGKQWVVKSTGPYLQPDHIRSEMISDRLYADLGLAVPAGTLIETTTGPQKITEYLEGGVTLETWRGGKSDAEIEAMNKKIRKGFVADALFANHDVAGMHLDNLFIVDGQPVRIDNGGALMFRAQGEAKSDFGAVVNELDSMRDEKYPVVAELFSGIGDDEIHDQIRHIVANRKVLISTIEDSVEQFAPNDDRKKLAGIIDARITYLEGLLPSLEVPPSKGVVLEKMEPIREITVESAKRVRGSRSNGVTIVADERDIEDTSMLVWGQKTAVGDDITRMHMKLTGEGSAKVVNKLKAVLAAADGEHSNRSGKSGDDPDPNNKVDIQYRFQELVKKGSKTVAYHSSDGAYNQTTLDEMKAGKRKLRGIASLSDGDMELMAKMAESQDKLTKHVDAVGYRTAYRTEKGKRLMSEYMSDAGKLKSVQDMLQAELGDGAPFPITAEDKDMALFYLGQIEDIEVAHHNGVKPSKKFKTWSDPAPLTRGEIKHAENVEEATAKWKALKADKYAGSDEILKAWEEMTAAENAPIERESSGMTARKVVVSRTPNTFDKGYSREMEEDYPPNRVGSTYEYEIDMGGGVTASFKPVPIKSNKMNQLEGRSGLALEGVFEITVPGVPSVDNIRKLKSVVEGVGIDTTPPSPAFEESLYIHRTLNQRLVKKDDDIRGQEKYDRIWKDTSLTDAERVIQQKKWVSVYMGVNLPGEGETTEWYNPAGQAMTSEGDGPRTWVSFLRTPDSVEDTLPMDKYMIYHAVGALTESRTGKIPNFIGLVLENGGEFTSTSDRFRKGVPVFDKYGEDIGASPIADVNSGGSAYVFTRIRNRYEADKRHGIFFKMRNVRRADSTHYSKDTYGAIAKAPKRANTVLGAISTEGIDHDNELIIKHGLSLIDEIDVIRVFSKAEKIATLNHFKKAGITRLPDGRAVRDIVLLSGESFDDADREYNAYSFENKGGAETISAPLAAKKRHRYVRGQVEVVQAPSGEITVDELSYVPAERVETDMAKQVIRAADNEVGKAKLQVDAAIQDYADAPSAMNKRRQSDAMAALQLAEDKKIFAVSSKEYIKAKTNYLTAQKRNALKPPSTTGDWGDVPKEMAKDEVLLLGKRYSEAKVKYDAAANQVKTTEFDLALVHHIKSTKSLSKAEKQLDEATSALGDANHVYLEANINLKDAEKAKVDALSGKGLLPGQKVKDKVLASVRRYTQADEALQNAKLKYDSLKHLQKIEQSEVDTAKMKKAAGDALYSVNMTELAEVADLMASATDEHAENKKKLRAIQAKDDPAVELAMQIEYLKKEKRKFDEMPASEGNQVMYGVLIKKLDDAEKWMSGDDAGWGKPGLGASITPPDTEQLEKSINKLKLSVEKKPFSLDRLKAAKRKTDAAKKVRMEAKGASEKANAVYSEVLGKFHDAKSKGQSTSALGRAKAIAKSEALKYQRRLNDVTSRFNALHSKSMAAQEKFDLAPMTMDAVVVASNKMVEAEVAYAAAVDEQEDAYVAADLLLDKKIAAQKRLSGISIKFYATDPSGDSVGGKDPAAIKEIDRAYEAKDASKEAWKLAVKAKDRKVKLTGAAKDHYHALKKESDFVQEKFDSDVSKMMSAKDNLKTKQAVLKGMNEVKKAFDSIKKSANESKYLTKSPKDKQILEEAKEAYAQSSQTMKVVERKKSQIIKKGGGFTTSTGGAIEMTLEESMLQATEEFRASKENLILGKAGDDVYMADRLALEAIVERKEKKLILLKRAYASEIAGVDDVAATVDASFKAIQDEIKAEADAVAAEAAYSAEVDYKKNKEAYIEKEVAAAKAEYHAINKKFYEASKLADIYKEDPSLEAAMGFTPEEAAKYAKDPRVAMARADAAMEKWQKMKIVSGNKFDVDAGKIKGGSTKPWDVVKEAQEASEKAYAKPGVFKDGRDADRALASDVVLEAAMKDYKKNKEAYIAADPDVIKAVKRLAATNVHGDWGDVPIEMAMDKKAEAQQKAGDDFDAGAVHKAMAKKSPVESVVDAKKGVSEAEKVWDKVMKISEFESDSIAWQIKKKAQVALHEATKVYDEAKKGYVKERAKFVDADPAVKAATKAYSLAVSKVDDQTDETIALYNEWKETTKKAKVAFDANAPTDVKPLHKRLPELAIEATIVGDDKQKKISDFVMNYPDHSASKSLVKAVGQADMFHPSSVEAGLVSKEKVYVEVVAKELAEITKVLKNSEKFVLLAEGKREKAKNKVKAALLKQTEYEAEGGTDAKWLDQSAVVVAAQAEAKTSSRDLYKAQSAKTKDEVATESKIILLAEVKASAEKAEEKLWDIRIGDARQAFKDKEAALKIAEDSKLSADHQYDTAVDTNNKLFDIKEAAVKKHQKAIQKYDSVAEDVLSANKKLHKAQKAVAFHGGHEDAAKWELLDAAKRDKEKADKKLSEMDEIAIRTEMNSDDAFQSWEVADHTSTMAFDDLDGATTHVTVTAEEAIKAQVKLAKLKTLKRKADQRKKEKAAKVAADAKEKAAKVAADAKEKAADEVLIVDQESTASKLSAATKVHSAAWRAVKKNEDVISTKKGRLAQAKNHKTQLTEEALAHGSDVAAYKGSAPDFQKKAETLWRKVDNAEKAVLEAEKAEDAALQEAVNLTGIAQIADYDYTASIEEHKIFEESEKAKKYIAAVKKAPPLAPFYWNLTVPQQAALERADKDIDEATRMLGPYGVTIPLASLEPGPDYEMAVKLKDAKKTKYKLVKRDTEAKIKAWVEKDIIPTQTEDQWDKMAGGVVGVTKNLKDASDLSYVTEKDAKSLYVEASHEFDAAQKNVDDPSGPKFNAYYRLSEEEAKGGASGEAVAIAHEAYKMEHRKNKMALKAAKNKKGAANKAHQRAEMDKLAASDAEQMHYVAALGRAGGRYKWFDAAIEAAEPGTNLNLISESQKKRVIALGQLPDTDDSTGAEVGLKKKKSASYVAMRDAWKESGGLQGYVEASIGESIAAEDVEVEMEEKAARKAAAREAEEAAAEEAAAEEAAAEEAAAEEAKNK